MENITQAWIASPVRLPVDCHVPDTNDNLSSLYDINKTMIYNSASTWQIKSVPDTDTVADIPTIALRYWRDTY